MVFSGPTTRARSLVAAVLVAVLAALGWWVQAGADGGGEAGNPASETPSGTASGTPSGTASETPSGTAVEVPQTDEVSGLPFVALADLPPEAADTIALIDRGGPFPYEEDGSTFGNYEGLLPDRPDGYYREYTVETPGSDDRGARRIVGGAEGELYWTEDHYESFEVIWR